MKKMPPLEKVYEAWSAIVDGRVKSDDFHAEEGSAEVVSSDGAKTYTVTWAPEKLGGEYAALHADGDNIAVPTVMTSNDNATYWQGYAGYPVIAVLMKQGKLPCNDDLAGNFANIDWHALNEGANRDYAKVVAEICSDRGIDPEAANSAASAVLEELGGLSLILKRGKPL